ncbi:MAG: uroporphyrinogen-III synthase, partial [Humibacter sp.]
MTTGPIPTQGPKPLAGWRVLVPRGGPWGDSVAADIRGHGGIPVVAPMINFAPTADEHALEEALTALAAGEFDWVTITSATTVDVLSAHQARIPLHTRVAAVGETTAAALLAAG